MRSKRSSLRPLDIERSYFFYGIKEFTSKYGRLSYTSTIHSNVFRSEPCSTCISKNINRCRHACENANIYLRNGKTKNRKKQKKDRSRKELCKRSKKCARKKHVMTAKSNNVPEKHSFSKSLSTLSVPVGAHVYMFAVIFRHMIGAWANPCRVGYWLGVSTPALWEMWPVQQQYELKQELLCVVYHNPVPSNAWVHTLFLISSLCCSCSCRASASLSASCAWWRQ